MTTSILVGYATSHGSTQEVAEAVAAALRECGAAVEVQTLGDVRSVAAYSAIVLGAPLYMYRWHKDAHRFLSRQRAALADRPVAVFALGPVHDPHDDAEWQDSWGQLKKALANYPWLTPVAIEMFGGRFDPELLRFPINLLAGSEPASDIRNWPAIHDWATSLAAKLMPAAL